MLGKIFNKKEQSKNTNQVSLTKFFYELENSEHSAFNNAVNSFYAIKDQCSNEDELLYFLLEDSLFTSLYATFYEHLLITVNQNQDVALQLIAKFKEQTDSREQILATQSQEHLSFIEHNGQCEGCQSCENHKDVEELIEPYQNKDINFFAELYIGMLTIQFAMEILIYEYIPRHPEICDNLTHEQILSWRQIIYAYATQKLQDN